MQVAAAVPALTMPDDKLQDYTRIAIARRDIEDAITLLQRARSAISVTAGEQRAGVRFITDALLEARKAHADVEHIIRQLGR